MDNEDFYVIVKQELPNLHFPERKLHEMPEVYFGHVSVEEYPDTVRIYIR